MNSKLKRKWVAALRSGKYKQGFRTLWRESDNSHCCLGVLEAIQGHKEPKGVLYNLRGMIDGAWSTYGVSEEERSILAIMNDGKRPFSDIADYIEDNRNF